MEIHPPLASTLNLHKKLTNKELKFYLLNKCQNLFNYEIKPKISENTIM
ncbi:hypothetical protein VCHA50O413_20640 [Vibrio chagasii]|nr:hypothetical protein VCHA34P114_30267 [Vibrio chagasii]CAH7034154.1 hypothetical protein VCHA50O405_10634 [Vibrio chagasii]CAH7123444.1 hypothetical protein VCHA50O402_20642 [Vibrio chagasii]CAH7173066.1 hypothetical protein VCHA50O413_20640 [Vibrio chagasii]CAH7236864.1 hypothetical protein VCHA50O409_40379 [Vibrio chagasii]